MSLLIPFIHFKIENYNWWCTAKLKNRIGNGDGKQIWTNIIGYAQQNWKNIIGDAQQNWKIE